MNDTPYTSEEIEAKYDEISMLREEREITINDYVAWQVYDHETDEEIAIIEDREEAYDVAQEGEYRPMYGLLEGDKRLTEQ